MSVLDVLPRHTESWGTSDGRLRLGLIVWTLFRATLVFVLVGIPLLLPAIAALPVIAILGTLILRASLMLDEDGAFGRVERWASLHLRWPTGAPRQWWAPALGFLVGSFGTAAITALLSHSDQATPTVTDLALGHPLGVFGVLIVVGLVHPFIEEVVFRGWLFDELSAWRGRRLATVVANLLWVFAHFSAARIPDLLLTGCALQYVRSKTGSLWASIALHAAFNSMVVIAPAMSDESNAAIEPFTPMHLLYLAGFAIIGWGVFFWGMRRVGGNKVMVAPG